MLDVLLLILVLWMIWRKGCSMCECKDCPDCGKKQTCKKCSDKEPSKARMSDLKEAFEDTDEALYGSSPNTHYPIYQPLPYGVRY
jgi:hypothetical protein